MKTHCMESPASDLSIVLDLERELQSPQVRRDLHRLTELLAPTFIEIGASGRRWDLPGILAMLAEETAAGDVREIDMVGLEGRELAAGVIQTFWDSHREVRRARRTSVWCQTPTGWQQVYHQGTLLA